MPFASRTRVGPENRVFDGGPDPSWEWAIFRGKGQLLRERTCPTTLMPNDTAVSCAKNG